MLTVACVLKGGGEYKPDHVARLRDGVAEHLTIPHEFVCMSDVPVPCRRLFIQHGWPKWWSKLELFRAELFDGPVLYIDLDSLIVGSLDGLALGHTFTVLRNFWAPAGSRRIGSGLMAWNADLSHIYRQFVCAPKGYMDAGVTKENLGDQGFIEQYSRVPFDYWQDKHPGKVVSYRRDCLRGVPPESSVVCFGGPVRPWNTHLWKDTQNA